MSKPSEDTKLEVLNSHYQDTQRIIEKAIRNRDRSFLLILVFLTIMAFQFFSPEQSGSVLTQAVEKQLNITAAISINYISSLIWFGLFAIAINYFQTVINLEKQYNYIHTLENELSKKYKGKAFTREGKSYLKNYPKFSKWLHIVYRVIFPALLIIAVAIKVVSEWIQSCTLSIPMLLNSTIFVFIVISTALYTISLFKMKKDSYK
jgi:hypothetical protein